MSLEKNQENKQAKNYNTQRTHISTKAARSESYNIKYLVIWIYVKVHSEIHVHAGNIRVLYKGNLICGY